MAPLLLNMLQPQHQVDARQNGPYLVTLTVTRPTSTYTTIVPLGASTSQLNSAATLPSPTTRLEPSPPLPTTQLIVPRDESSDPGVVAGAVIGGVLGFLVLLVLLYKCCYDNRSALWFPPRHSSVDDSDSDVESRRSYVRRRGGDAGWSRSNRRGDGVRKPGRAKVRRGYRSDSSDSSADRSRRRPIRRAGRATDKNGMVGWYFTSVGSTRRGSRGHNGYDSRRDVWSNDRGKSIDD